MNTKKTQIMLFMLDFAAISFSPVAMRMGDGAMDLLFLIILSINFFSFYYRDRYQHQNRNLLKQVLFIILSALSLICFVMGLCWGSGEYRELLYFIVGMWILGEGLIGMIIKMWRQPVEARALGYGAHPYQKDRCVPWFSYRFRDKDCRGFQDVPVNANTVCPSCGEFCTVYICRWSPLDCSITTLKPAARDYVLTAFGLSLLLRIGEAI